MTKMQPASRNLDVFRGDDVDFLVRLWARAGEVLTPLDVSNSEFELVFGKRTKKTDNGSLTLSTSGGVTSVGCRLDPNDTLRVLPGLGSVYKLIWIHPDRGRRTLLTGSIGGLGAPLPSGGDVTLELYVNAEQTVVEIEITDSAVVALAARDQSLASAQASAASASQAAQDRVITQAAATTATQAAASQTARFATLALANASPTALLAYIDADGANNGAWSRATTGTNFVRFSTQTLPGLDNRATELEAVSAALQAPVILGRPIGADLSGGVSTNTNTYISVKPIPAGVTHIDKIEVNLFTAGDFYVSEWTDDGGTVTFVKETAFLGRSAGLQTLVLNSPTVPGRLLAVYGTARIAQIQSSFSDTLGIYSLTGKASGTVTKPAVLATNRFLYRISFRRQAVSVSTTAASVTKLQRAAEARTAIGRPLGSTLVSGGTGSANTVRLADLVAVPSVLRRVRFWALAAGTLYIRVRSAGTTKSIVSETPLLAAAAGPVTFDVEIPLDVGQSLEYFGPGMVASVAGTADGLGYTTSSGQSLGDVTPGTPLTGNVLQISFEIGSYRDTSILEEVDQIRSSAGIVSATPEAFVVIHCTNQSNGAGRAPTRSSITLPMGVAYKFVRSSGTLERLVDPTGNDSSALADGGKGSYFPALAEAIWRLSGGRLGVIVINSSVGSTRVDVEWATSGSAWTQAVSDFNTAMGLIKSMKLPIVGFCLAGVSAETPAGANITAADYKTAALDLYARAGALTGLGNELPWIISQLGTRKSGESGYPGWQVVRNAQNDLVRQNSNIFFGFTAAKYHGDSGRGGMFDELHMDLPVLEMWGRSEASVTYTRALGKIPSAIND